MSNALPNDLQQLMLQIIRLKVNQTTAQMALPVTEGFVGILSSFNEEMRDHVTGDAAELVEKLSQLEIYCKSNGFKVNEVIKLIDEAFSRWQQSDAEVNSAPR